MADLATLSEYKAYMGINSTNNDTIVTILLASVSKLVRTYCSRSFTEFYATNKVELHDGGGIGLNLVELPIISVASFEYSTDGGSTYTPLTLYTDYVISAEHGVIRQAKGKPFAKSYNGYKVTYMAGYAICPEDLKLAVFDLVTYYSRSDMAVKSTRLAGSVGSGTVEYVTTANFPSHIRRVLDMYRVGW
ncbi:MAG: phage head-tail connector protein [bacterium]